MLHICFMYFMTHALTYKDHEVRIAIVIALKELNVKCKYLVQKVQKHNICTTCWFCYRMQSVHFWINRTTHYIRIMDGRNCFLAFELLCLWFWLVMFFCCLGPFLVWCGWARTDDHGGVSRNTFHSNSTIRTQIRRATIRHQQIKESQRRNSHVV